MIITLADLQSLKALKREFIDSKGFLKSWIDTGHGACSGDWVGIKCVQGQVIAVQLPWKGLGGKIQKNRAASGAPVLSVHNNVLMGPIPNS